ncbi:hypothetical protein CPAV1605_38 [seawater metagenome]|uniref:Uncharacterized protein n=1 Tax=seawater metagenome TaxID=1561972 RepID=A0A5E8CH15_9ZZZZ
MHNNYCKMTTVTTNIEQLEQQLKLLKTNKSLEKFKENICFKNESWYPYIHNIKLDTIESEANYRDDDEYHHDISGKLKFSYDFIKENGIFEESSDIDLSEDDIENPEEPVLNEKLEKLKENPKQYSDNVTKILKSINYSSNKITKFNYEFIINFFDNNLNIDNILKPLLFEPNFYYKNFVIYVLNKKNKEELIEIANRYDLTFSSKKPSKKIIIDNIVDLFVQFLVREQEEAKKKEEEEKKKKEINYTVSLDVYKTSYSDYYQRYDNTINEECTIKITDNSGNHSNYNVKWNVNGDYGVQYSFDYDNKKKYYELFLMEKVFDKVCNSHNEDWISFIDAIKT